MTKICTVSKAYILHIIVRSTDTAAVCVVAVCCWTVFCCVLGDSAAWTVSCVLPDEVCLRRDVQNHFGQHFFQGSSRISAAEVLTAVYRGKSVPQKIRDVPDPFTVHRYNPCKS